jgi:hypothetical protein
MMPPQLARGLAERRAKPRRFRGEPKPLAECLPSINVNDLARYRVFPSQWHVSHTLELPFRYPFVKRLVVSLAAIKAHHHSGYNQTIPLRWVATGFGGSNRPRALLGCRCCRTVTKLYFDGGRLACRRCVNAIHASQVLDKRTRPALQAHRLQAFIMHKPTLWPKTKQSLQARIAKLKPSPELTSKRIGDRARLPVSNYQSQACPLWC